MTAYDHCMFLKIKHACSLTDVVAILYTPVIVFASVLAYFVHH